MSFTYALHKVLNIRTSVTLLFKVDQVLRIGLGAVANHEGRRIDDVVNSRIEVSDWSSWF